MNLQDYNRVLGGICEVSRDELYEGCFLIGYLNSEEDQVYVIPTADEDKKNYIAERLTFKGIDFLIFPKKVIHPLKG